MRERTLGAPRRLLALLVAVLVQALLSAPAAFAHADLVSTTPATGTSVDDLGQLELVFTEPVKVLPSAVRVLDGDGQPVTIGEARPEADRVIVPIEGLATGGYLVSWRVVSADGHPVEGSFTFGLGAPALSASAAIAESAPSPVRSAAVGLEVLAALVLAGAWLSRRVVVREDAHRQIATTIARRAALVGLAATTVLLPGRLTNLLGVGLVEAFTPSNLAAFAGTTSGRSSLLRLVALAAFLWATGRRERRGAPVLAAAGAIGAAASFAIDGHTRTVDSFLAGTGADLVHLAAGSAWLGGLLVLATVLRRSQRRDAVVLARVVARFSAVATVAVVAVTGAGAVLADAILPGGVAVGASTYGTALVAKTTLVAILVAFGAYNHVALVPAVQRAAHPLLAGGSSDAVPTGLVVRGRRRAATGDAATRSLRRTLRVEGAAFLAVLLLTGALVDLSPPPPVTSTPVTAYLDLGGGLSAKFDATVDARGAELVTVRLINRTGQAGKAERVTLFVRNEGLGIPATPTDMLPAGEGLWTLDADVLPLAGTWDIDVVARTSRFAEEGTGVIVTVPAA